MNEQVIQHLYSLRNEYRSLRYDLRNTEILCEALGNPHKKFRSALIAGTNGKGSVAKWLSEMVPEAGLYTSPHLERLNERISIGGVEINDRDLETVLSDVRRAISKVESRLLYPPTYFEWVTAAAFCYFSKRVSHAILEVGLGGRLDATNVVSQDVSVITSIGYDHAEYLGTTLEQIAAEKAGIIKGSEPVVLGPGCDFEVIRKRSDRIQIDAQDARARVHTCGRGLFRVDLETPVRTYTGLKPSFAGRHQIDNLKVAVRTAECLEQLGWPINGDRIAQGVNTAIWPGRLETVRTEPTFLIDGAHNVPAAEALGRYLTEYYPENVWLIFGGMREKDLPEMIRILEPHSRGLILTRPSDPRSADPRDLGSQFKNAVLTQTTAKAIAWVRQHARRQDAVLVTGSLYLAGEVRAQLANDSVLSAGPSAASS